VTAAVANIHASCVMLARAGKAFGAPAEGGVLLLGPSGAGKSDLALRLIAEGAKLVADDRTELTLTRGKLWARPPKRLAGLIEVRGLGIIHNPYAPRAHVILAVELADDGERLPEEKRFHPPQLPGLKATAAPPLIRLKPFEASATAKIAAAAAAYAHGLYRDDANPI
jgi:HPr kinase/phosphorylase